MEDTWTFYEGDEMHLFRRIALFLALNLAVLLMVSLLLNFLNIRPYLTEAGVNYTELLLFCLVWGFTGALISLALSRKIAKWTMGVKVISPSTKNPEELELLRMVHALAQEAHLPALPEVGIYRSNEVNAFATGPSRARSLVAVSTGLLSRMQEREIRGVLGHEVAHIANGDMVTMTLLQGVVNAFVMFLARVLAIALSSVGKKENRGGGYGSYYLLTFLFEILFFLVGSMIIAAYSRFREFRADRGGARLAGKESMLAALQALRVLQEIKDPEEKGAAAIAALKISTKKSGFQLFATHPPLEERIARLQNRE